jgi:phosphoglycolate phosphatase-like HAD superfamily hydrolase
MAGWIVLFDWDGTLIDSLELKVHNAGVLFEQALHIPRIGVEAAYRQHSGIPRRQLFDAICRDSGLPALEDEKYEQLSERFSAANCAALCDPQTPGLVPPGTWQALERLRYQGVSLYVSSSAEAAEIRAIAAGLGLEKFFKEILGSTPGFAKGRQHVDYVLRKEAAAREQVLFVGDDPADIRIGKQAGVRTIAKTGTNTVEVLAREKPDHFINSLDELLGLLDGLSPVSEFASGRNHPLRQESSKKPKQKISPGGS